MWGAGVYIIFELWCSLRGKARQVEFLGSQVLDNCFEFISSFLFTISNAFRYAITEFPFLRPQTKFAKVMFLHLSVIRFTGRVSASVYAGIHILQ